MKYAFVFHFLIGGLVYSNDKILSSSGTLDLFKEVLEGTDEDQVAHTWFRLERFSQNHVIIFIVGNIGLMLILFFESTLITFFVKNFNCFKNYQKKFESMDAISDDYYEVLDLKFLVSEYERTKQEK